MLLTYFFRVCLLRKSVWPRSHLYRRFLFGKLYLNEFLKIGLGLERLFFFVIVFVIVIHVITCIWIITAQMAKIVYGFDNDENEEKNYESWRDDYED